MSKKDKQTKKSTTDLPTAMSEPHDDDSVYGGYNPPANSSPGSLYSNADNQSSTKTPGTAVQSTAQSPIRLDQSRAQSPMVAPPTPESEPYDDDDDDDVDPMYGVFIPPANYSPASLCSSGTDDGDDDDDGIGGTAPPSSPVRPVSPSPSPSQHRHRGAASPAATDESCNGPLATEYGVGSGNGLGPRSAIRQDRVDGLVSFPPFPLSFRGLIRGV